MKKLIVLAFALMSACSQGTTAEDAYSKTSDLEAQLDNLAHQLRQATDRIDDLEKQVETLSSDVRQVGYRVNGIESR